MRVGHVLHSRACPERMAVIVRCEPMSAYVYVRWVRPRNPDGNRLSAFTKRDVRALFSRVWG